MRRPGCPFFRQVWNRFRTVSRVGPKASRGTGAIASFIGSPPFGILITDDTPDCYPISRRLTERTQRSKLKIRSSKLKGQSSKERKGKKRNLKQPQNKPCKTRP